MKEPVTAKRLSPRARQLVRDIRALEIQLGLSVESALDLWSRDRDASLAHLRSIRDQIVRSEVLTEYTIVDEFLGLELRRHFFGARRRHNARAPRRRTLDQILAILYPLQKLELIERYRKVPRPVSASIRALNQTRNSFAHSFFFRNQSGHRVLYKKIDIFTPGGLAQFTGEMEAVKQFLAPSVMSAIYNFYSTLDGHDSSQPIAEP